MVASVVLDGGSGAGDSCVPVGRLECSGFATLFAGLVSCCGDLASWFVGLGWFPAFCKPALSLGLSKRRILVVAQVVGVAQERPHSERSLWRR